MLFKNIGHRLPQMFTDNGKKGNYVRRKPSWEGDSITRILGMSDSDISDGAENHDLYIYGDHE